MKTESLVIDGDYIITCDMATNGDLAVETRTRMIDGGLRVEGCRIVDEIHDHYTKEEALKALAVMDNKVIRDALREGE